MRVPPRCANPGMVCFLVWQRLVDAEQLVRADRRLAALVVLLQGFDDLRDSSGRGDGDTYRGGGLLLRDHERHCLLLQRGSRCSCVHSGLDELERLLGLMRLDEPRLRWHVVAFFVDARERGRWEWRKRKGRRHAGFVYRRWLERDPRANRELAVAGARWLAGRWGLRDLRGELVEPWLVAPGLDRGMVDKLDSRHSGLVRSVAGSRL